MIVSVIILGLLAISFRIGVKKGLLAMLINLIGYGVVLGLAFFLARYLGDGLANIFDLAHLTAGSRLFCRLLAFWTVILVGGIIWRMIAHTLRTVTKMRGLRQLNALAGGLLSMMVTYIMIFFSLVFLVSWPTATWQNRIEQSQVAQFILNNTPDLTQYLQ